MSAPLYPINICNVCGKEFSPPMHFRLDLPAPVCQACQAMSAQGHTPGEYGKPFGWAIVDTRGRLRTAFVHSQYDVAGETIAMPQAGGEPTEIPLYRACSGLPDPERDVAEMLACLSAILDAQHGLYNLGKLNTDVAIEQARQLHDRARAILARFDAKEAQ